MLNQDPENVNSDYTVAYDSEEVKKHITGNRNYKKSDKPSNTALTKTTETAVESLRPLNRTQRFIKTKGIYVAMAATFLGLFAGIPLLIIFYSNTMVSLGNIFFMFFICGALGLIQWRFVKDLLDLEYHQFSMYAFSGFGMCLINFIFFLNHTVSFTSYSKTYEVISFYPIQDGYEIVLAGEGHEPALERNVASFIFSQYKEVSKPKKVTVVVATGLFGFEMVNDCKINQ
jgi:hypothetical protein